MDHGKNPDRAEASSNRLHEALLQTSCTRCHKLHHPEQPLEFDSVCSACAGGSSTLRMLEMAGCYPLSDEAIDRLLTRTSPGNYALGYMDDASFVVFYVGRSDSDVRQRLHDWVGVPSRYDRYAPASKAAWGLRPGSAMPLGRPALGRVGVGSDSSYTCFAYSYAPSAAAAFEKECRNYADFGGCGELDNETDPERTPEIAKWSATEVKPEPLWPPIP